MFCIELNFCCVLWTLLNLVENQNNVTEFVFIGLWGNKKIELLFFSLFPFCYLAILMGNFSILLTIICSHLMQQPMYYFLCHHALMDVSYTSTVVPKLIRDLAAARKNISYNNCMTQLFTAHLLVGVEISILVSMAFDHYIAIVKPLHYMVIMNRHIDHPGLSCQFSAFYCFTSHGTQVTFLWS